MPKMPQLPWTDTLRGLSCVLVIVWHVLHTLIYRDELPTAESNVVLIGYVAREVLLIFIVLSGYLLGRHWDHRGPMGQVTKVYLVRRTVRIVPPYLFGLLLVILAMAFLGLRNPSGTPWDTGLPFNWTHTLASAFMVTDFFGWVPLGHPFWTVPYEFHMYFLAPLVVLLARRQTRVLALGVALMVVGSLLVPLPAPTFPIAFVLSFWAGMRRQEGREWNRRELWTVLWPFLVAIVPVAVVAMTTTYASDSIRHYMIGDALVAPILLVWIYRSDLTHARDWLIRTLEWRPFRWSGERSYSIYLGHAIVVELLWRWYFDEKSGWGALFSYSILAVAISLALGEVLYRAVELPSAKKSAAIGRSARKVSTP